MWSPPSGEEIVALHTEGIDFVASCEGAESCSGSLTGGPVPGAVVQGGASSVSLVVPPPVDWFEPSHLWVYGRSDPIVGWPQEPLAADLTFYRAPRDHIQRRVLRCTALVRDAESGALSEVSAEYPVVVLFDHSPGRDRVVQEVSHASGGAPG